MKKFVALVILLFVFACLPAFAEQGTGYESFDISDASFPDPIFKAYVLKNADANKDNKISYDENMAVTRMLISNMKIADLKGVELFKNLQMLSCDTNELKELNLSEMTTLKELWCKNNSLSSLNLKGCTSLSKLVCYNNNIEELDLSLCKELAELSCPNNSLTKLDLSQNKKLEALYCYGNKLNSLVVKDCGLLERLSCYDNKLSELILPSGIVSLWCNDNEFTQLDVSDCQKLILLNCQNNKIEALNLINCSNITKLNCAYNNIKQLNISNCSILTSINCENNFITKLDLSQNSLDMQSCAFSPQTAYLDFVYKNNPSSFLAMFKADRIAHTRTYNGINEDEAIDKKAYMLDGQIVDMPDLTSERSDVFELKDAEGNIASMELIVKYANEQNAPQNMKGWQEIPTNYLIVVFSILAFALLIFVVIKLKSISKSESKSS